MADMKDHDPDEGAWLSPAHLAAEELYYDALERIMENPKLTMAAVINEYLDELNVGENPNIIRGYN